MVIHEAANVVQMTERRAEQVAEAIACLAGYGYQTAQQFKPRAVRLMRETGCCPVVAARHAVLPIDARNGDPRDAA